MHASSSAPRTGATRAWRGDGIPRGPVGLAADGRQELDPGESRYVPRLDRVSRWHARWYPPRVLEPEVMAEVEVAAAYGDAAAHEHLQRLDARWAEQVLIAGPHGPARVLDIGTGGGQIPVMLARRRPAWRIWAIDRARAMLFEGLDAVVRAAAAAHREARPFRLALGQAEARKLPFGDGAFDLVVSNSLLHHLADPSPILDEIGRVAGPHGKVVLRDLRRPARPGFRFHVARQGRAYAGEMRRLFEASVAAAFTPDELAIILRHTALAGAFVRREGPYLVIER